MILSKINNCKKIYPYKTEQVIFWAKKWGINSSDLNDAIISTGSLRVQVLKEYLVKKGCIISITGIVYNLKMRLQRVIDKWNDDEGF